MFIFTALRCRFVIKTREKRIFFAIYFAGSEKSSTFAPLFRQMRRGVVATSRLQAQECDASWKANASIAQLVEH